MRSVFIKSLTLAAVAALALASACTTTAEGDMEEPTWVVIQPNASVSLREVNVRSWARDNSILLKTHRDEWYRGVLMGGCTEAFPGAAIGFETDSGDLVDRGSSAIIGGQECRLVSFDRIEAPAPGARR